MGIFPKLQSLVQMDASTQIAIKNFLIYYYYIFLTTLFISLTAFLTASARDILSEAKKISIKSWFIVLIIFNFALIYRLFFISPHPQVFYDEVTFIETAENYFRYGLNIQNYMGPGRNEFLICSTGWPFLISLVFRITGVNINAAFYLSALLSSLTVIFVFFLGTLLFNNESSGIWSSLIYSVYPVSIRLSNSSAMETPSIFFIFLTLLAFAIYFRQRTIPLLYFSFLCLAYTINIRQEAFLTLLPLLMIFFLLFHPDIKSEFKRIHIYVCILLAIIFSIPPSLASYFGVASGFYYFYEPPEMMQKHILHNIQYNLTYWLSNRIQPLAVTILAVFAFVQLFRNNKRLCLYFAGWFGFLYVFYTLNPSCDFGALITLDSWRNVSHLIIPIILFAGAGSVIVVQYFQENYPNLTKPVIFALIIAIVYIPFRFDKFIQHKTIYARENIFINHFSRKVPPNSRVIVDGGIKKSLWESYMSQFSYTSKVPGKFYGIDPGRPFSSRKLIRDLHIWKDVEGRPIFLYLTTVDTKDLDSQFAWYFELFELRMVGGFGIRKLKKSFILYEILGPKNAPYFVP